MSKPSIRLAIQRGLARQAKTLDDKAKALGISKERILEELRHLALSKVSNYAEVTEDENGQVEVRMKPTKNWKAGADRAVKEIIPGKDGAIGIKLHSKENAIGQIADILGWNKKQIELTGAEGGPIQIAAVSLADAVRNAEIAKAALDECKAETGAEEEH